MIAFKKFMKMNKKKKTLNKMLNRKIFYKIIEENTS